MYGKLSSNLYVSPPKITVDEEGRKMASMYIFSSIYSFIKSIVSSENIKLSSESITCTDCK